MDKRPHYLLSLFFVFSFFLARAQDTVETTNVDSIEQTLTPPVEEEEQHFSPLKQTPAVITRKIPDSKVQELKNKEDYWYANVEPEKKKIEEPDRYNGPSIFFSGWFKAFMWLLIIGTMVVAIGWYLGISQISLFRKAAKQITSTEEEQLIEEDIFTVNYDREIAKATAAENYRLAIRLWYLFTLKELSQRNLIRYEAQKTNSEYVMQLFGGRYYKDFFQLTRDFNYVWYGQFPITKEDFNLMQTDFQQFKSGLS